MNKLREQVEQAIRIHWSRKNNTTAYEVAGELITIIRTATLDEVEVAIDKCDLVWEGGGYMSEGISGYNTEQVVKAIDNLRGESDE